MRQVTLRPFRIGRFFFDKIGKKWYNIIIKFNTNFMSSNADRIRAIGEHAKNFRASNTRVNAEAKPTTVDRTREAQARVAAVREAQAVRVDAAALIKQRGTLEGVTDDEIDMSVGALTEGQNTGPTAKEIGTGQALECAFEKYKKK